MHMKQVLAVITKPQLAAHAWQDALLAIPRILCGYWLTVHFGAPKFGLPWSPPENNLGFFEVAFWFPGDVAAFGGVFAWAPALLAWMAAFAEAIGGIAWMIGFQTRLFSILIGITMLVAALAQQFDQGLWNMLPALGILWVAVHTSVMGSGRFGIDYLISQKNRNV